MAPQAFYALLCASVVVTAGPADAGSPTPAGDRDAAVAQSLAVQTALQQGREHLLHNDFRSAVYVLEGQLSRINGNRVYLALLQDAYRGYVKELRLTKQDAEAQKYLDRLRILDPGAVLDKTLTAPAATAPPAAAPAAKPPATVRLKGEEEKDDPFSANQAKPAAPSKGQQLAARADREFTDKHYREARLLYEQAYREDPAVAEACRERWAYCKLDHVVEQLNGPAAGSPPADLEGEVRRAMSLAPRLEEHGKSLLAELQKRRARGLAGEGTRPEVTVRHYERNAEGYYCAETANFRVFHNQPRDLAEQAARAAEWTRADMQRKWFGAPGADWSPKCDLYLHATGQDYSRVTGVPGSSPGHSSIRMEAGRVIGRRIDLHADDPNMVVAVLPHETTHVVLAGRFGDTPVPRWADEGMAVLTEPREKVERHLRHLDKCRQEGQQLFSLRQLMQLQDYPDPRYVGAFYAESVSLVEFLAREKGPQVFAEFLREGMRGGYEPALERYYHYRSFDELEQRWSQQAFHSDALPAGVADRGR